MSRPVYVWRVIVERWPDWCPHGWQRVYSDNPRHGVHVLDEDAPRLPAELRRLADEGLLPDDLVHERVMHPVYPDNEVEGDEWEVIVCPKRDRRNWLSGPAAYRWARHAEALGATVRVERGIASWEVES